MNENKVLHVFGQMQPGGAEKRTLEVMRHLRTQGFICDVVALSGQSGSLDHEVQALGGVVHLLRRQVGWRARFRALLREHDYRVVHSHVHYFSGVILREAARAGVPIRIAHFRGMDDGKGAGVWRRMYRAWMRHLIAKHATAVLAVSRVALAAACMPAGPPTGVVYNGLDLSCFAQSIDSAMIRNRLNLPPPSVPVVMHVGNFTAAKNHQLVLNVFLELARRRDDVHLALIGRGGSPEEQAVRAQIAHVPCVSRIHMLGTRDDVPDLLRVADAFLFPSLYEGLPGALLEACAAGLPCVASDIEPCQEIASRLSLVRCLSLQRPLDEWVDALDGALMHRRDVDPVRCRQRMQEAGFDVITSAAIMQRLWSGVPADIVLGAT